MLDVFYAFVLNAFYAFVLDVCCKTQHWLLEFDTLFVYKQKRPTLEIIGTERLEFIYLWPGGYEPFM